MEEMTRTEAIEFLRAQRVGHLGVVDDGVPYVTPISFVISGETVYFRTRPGRRLDAILANPKICLEASVAYDDVGMWRSVCVWGDAIDIDDEHVKADVVSLLLAKYSEASEPILSFARGASFGAMAHVVAVGISEITGRVSGRETGAGVRPGRL